MKYHVEQHGVAWIVCDETGRNVGGPIPGSVLFFRRGWALWWCARKNA